MEKFIISAFFNEVNAKKEKYVDFGLMYIPYDIEIIDDGKKGFKRVELAAISSAFYYVKSLGEEILYENTLVMILHGIDLITKKANEYIIYEIKGTTKPIKSPKFYLKKTKNKGRQLSWEWCWKLLCEMAYNPMTSRVFLELYEEMIYKKIKRKLMIVECEKLSDGSYMGKKVNLFNADELLIDDYNFEKERKFIENLKSENE